MRALSRNRVRRSHSSHGEPAGTGISETNRSFPTRYVSAGDGAGFIRRDLGPVGSGIPCHVWGCMLHDESDCDFGTLADDRLSSTTRAPGACSCLAAARPSAPFDVLLR